MSQSADLDWQGMTCEQRARALYKIYLDPKYHFRPGEVIGLRDGEGRVWLRLAARNFKALAVEVSGLTRDRAKLANDWLIKNGLACTTGVGSGSTHYVRQPKE